MGGDVLPPLNVQQAGGNPDVIPVFVIVATNMTVTDLGGGKVQLNPTAASGAPVGSPYVTYGADATLSAERILTAGSSVTVSSDATFFYINALTGGGGSTVYAATGNQYIVISAAADLTDEYILRGSTGVSLTSAGNVVLIHYGSLLVTSSRAINTLYPLSGGANLSADRTIQADTAFLVTSARQVLTVYPLSGGGNLGADQTFAVTTGGFLVVSSRAINTTAPLAGGGNLAADRTLTVDTLAVVASGRQVLSVFPLSGGGDLSADRTFSATTGGFFVLSSRAISFGSALFVGGGNLGADRTITIGTPIGVGSGGTGQLTLTAQGIIIGSGVNALYATSGLNAGMILVGSGIGMNPQIIGSGATGQMLISTGGLVAGNVAWVASGGGSSVVYAATGNQYVTISGATDLTDEYVIQASTGISLTSASNIVYVHYGSLLVTSTRAINTTYPVAGGGNLSADRTFTVDTSFLVTSARAISFGSALFVGGGNLGADRTITIGTPIGVGSGGTGDLTLTAQGILIGSGINAIYSTSGLNAGMILAGSGIGMNPQIIGSGGVGTQLISSAGLAGNLAWVATGGGGGSGTVNAGTGGNIAFYSGDGTTVDDIPPIGSSNTLLGVNSGGSAYVHKVLAAGANITLTHTNSGLTIAATTGGPGTGTVNAGSVTYLAYYPQAGSTVDDFTVTGTTGGGIAQFNVAILTSPAASVVSGDFWIQSSNNKIYLFVSSNATSFGVELS